VEESSTYPLRSSINCQHRISTVGARQGPGAVQLRLQEDVHLMPRQQVKLALTPITVDGELGSEGVLSIHSMLKKGLMLVKTEEHKGQLCVWHTLQNDSKEDTVMTVSLAAGQTVAFVKQHQSVDDYLNYRGNQNPYLQIGIHKQTSSTVNRPPQRPIQTRVVTQCILRCYCAG
jgi:hypothetical protein